jgi:hypothetical protein
MSTQPTTTVPNSVASLAPKPSLKVWEYEVPAKAKNEGFSLRMPMGAKVLTVMRGDFSAKLFALVNPLMDEEDRLFYVAGTNISLPEPEPDYKSLNYVASYVAYGRSWHLFEVERFREAGDEGL